MKCALLTTCCQSWRIALIFMSPPIHPITRSSRWMLDRKFPCPQCGKIYADAKSLCPISSGVSPAFFPLRAVT